ncbi:hypothetical protein [Bifidobacterium sp.]|jgi:hypothetical protein|uniref:hypothetical protein n=1 Tax=Bifidobacterium sp. TaxID=41200 RepID=UPI0025C671D1|nr:hypothetical protein [Bifidobacterium sp.]MCH4210047.1 hypothetical protein [Bifidobacterium sp.]
MSNRRAARAKALKAKNKKNITAMSSRDRYITGRCLACHRRFADGKTGVVCYGCAANCTPNKLDPADYPDLETDPEAK